MRVKSANFFTPVAVFVIIHYIRAKFKRLIRQLDKYPEGVYNNRVTKGRLFMENNLCFCGKEKKTCREEGLKRSLQNRLKRIEGQVRGIEKMIENEAYCNDVLIQSAAVSAALRAFNRELLKNHMHTCVLRDIKAGEEGVIDELAETLYKLMK